jgi:multicomponent Na+:H+ antiporter subunit E
VTARLPYAVLLVAIWLLILASLDPLDVVLGAVVAAAVMAMPLPGAPLERRDPPVARRIVAFPRFLAAVFWDVTSGTWDVALRVLHLRPLDQPGIIEVPFGERTERGVAVSALATTLSPGTVLLDVDVERRVMILHVIDASDPDAVRASLDRFYERAQKGVFP